MPRKAQTPGQPATEDQSNQTNTDTATEEKPAVSADAAAAVQAEMVEREAATEENQAFEEAVQAEVTRRLADNETLQGMIAAHVSEAVAKAQLAPPEQPTSAVKPCSVEEANKRIAKQVDAGENPRPILSVEGWVVPNIKQELPDQVRLS